MEYFSNWKIFENPIHIRKNRFSLDDLIRRSRTADLSQFANRAIGMRRFTVKLPERWLAEYSERASAMTKSFGACFESAFLFSAVLRLFNRVIRRVTACNFLEYEKIVLLPRGSNNPRESTICAISNFLIETNFPPAVSISLIFIINRILGNLERNSYSRG